ncbi:hypothetical protein AWC38_SpisGene19831 [Stylophora pistillata]|uniref:Peptidase aspartic putative domain-containing protein n=1 Tax=Stylophora pistillata TaxID=50429 RepID=A0A2B4RE72_STYPI|nr:hypothetical protein AWC38_SpisGene19831 [Stylophora pistillata]
MKIMELDQVFVNFKGAHDVYTKSLVEENSIMESRGYFENENRAVKELKESAGFRISELLFTFTPPAQVDILPEDSISQVGSGTRSRASGLRSKSSRSSSSASSTRLKHVQEAAKRKALEAKLKVFEEQQALAEKKFQSQQQEELLRIKSDLAQTAAKEEVHTEADDLGRRSEFEAKPEGSLSQVKEPLQEMKKPAVTTCDPLAPGSSSENTPLLVNAASPPGSDVETIQRMIEFQERQTKCMEGLVAKQQQSALSLTLPKQEVPIFSGDPIQYCAFVKAFECLIESKTSSNSERLYCLVMYTRGEVHELMSSYLTINPDEGYPEARKILKKRFGENYRIATAYVDKVTKGPALKAEDSKGVVERLPFDLRKKWSATADKITEGEDREIRFDDIVAFFEKESRTSSHPVFGDILRSNDQEREKKGTRNSKFKNNNFATRVGSDNHPPPPVITNETQSQSAVSQDHSNPPVWRQQGAVTPVSNGSVGFVGSTNSVIGFPIIPMKVKARGHQGYVVTHAFLDSGSNSTFCTEELLRQLNQEGEETSLSLSTIEKENSGMECYFVSLEAYGLEENAFFDLPIVFSTPILSVSPEDNPRQEDIVRWPHLHGICLPQVDAQVGLLLGNDNAKALEPIEIRQSRGEGPYAVRTVFGWTVNGPLGRESDGASHSANLIRGDTQQEKQFKRFCEL